MTRTLPFATGRDRDAYAPDVAQHLQRGGWIAYPTETVYGLGCALLPEPLRALAAAKRPGGHRPFLLLVPAGWRSEALRWTDGAKRLAVAFWPGPLTLALAAEPDAFPPEVTGADGTVAIRQSPHPGVRAIVEVLAAPITSTSANAPGEPPALDARAAAVVPGRFRAPCETWVLDGGQLPPGPASTLVRAVDDEVRVMREGAIRETEIRLALGK